MKLAHSLLVFALALGLPASAPLLRAQSPSSTLTTLRQFRAPATIPAAGNLDQERGSLVPAGDGSFYGTTAAGGAHGAGTVFRLTADGTLSVLYSFDAVGGKGTNRGGAQPDPGLVLGRDGNLYGTTAAGGAHGAGTVFLLTPDRVVSTLHSFDANPGGATLLEGRDGNLYGTTAAGGAHGAGTVFQLTRDGVFLILHAFGGNDGSKPQAALVLGRDGNLYGTTAAGGAHGAGTVFRLIPGKDLTTLHHFDSGNGDGARPLASLVPDDDGSLLGTASSGGAGGAGTVFRVDRDGTLTTLHSFGTLDDRGANADGAEPQAALVAGGDGRFYGTTAAGGMAGQGTIFQVTRTGLFASLYEFNGNSAGPRTALAWGQDGRLYGTTGGGADGGGTFFRLDAAAAAGVASPLAAGTRLTLQTGVGTTTLRTGTGTTPTSPLLTPILPGRLPISSAAMTSTWLGGTDVWSNAAKWNGGIPDGANADAYIDGGKTGISSVVSLDSSRTVGRLTVDKGDTLTINDNTNFYVTNAGGFTGSGTIINNGTLNLGVNAANGGSSVYLNSPVTLTGTGTLNLAKSNAYLFATNAGDRLTINAGTTITGLGYLGNGQTSFTNNGTVTANSSGNTLYLQPGGSYDFTNGAAGITHAENGGTLQLNGGTFVGGAFSALTGSTVQVVSAGVSGATLSSAGTGVVNLYGGSTLANVTNAGSLLLADNNNVYLSSSFTNNGTFTVGVNAANGGSSVYLSNPVTLAGTGTLNLAKSNASLTAVNSGDRLTINASATIAGQGNLGEGQTSFTNNGTVTANQKGQTLLVVPGSAHDFTSAVGSASRAENGGTLELGSGTFASGIFTALDGSQIRLDDPAINNATFVTTGTGSVYAGGRPALTNLTNTGTLLIADNVVTLAAGTLTNNGTITIGNNASNGGTSLVEFGGLLSFGGTGTINLPKSNAYLYANANGEEVAFGAGQTVQGLGNLGNGQTNFTNLGLVTANQNGQTLVINPGSGNAFVNNPGGSIFGGSTTVGSARAENGGVLQLNGGTFAGGAFSALTGSTVQVVSAGVSGATLSSAGTGVVNLYSNSTLANVTNAGSLLLADNNNVYLSSSFTNNGTFTVGVNAANGGSSVYLSNPVTLAGTGTLNLAKSNASLTAVNSGDRLTINAGTTITGLGNLGEGQTSFTNNGLITSTGKGNSFNIVPGGNPDANKVPASFVNSVSTVYDKNNVASTVLGTVEARDGGTISFTNSSGVPVTNQGLFQALTATADNSSFTLPSGSLTNFASVTPTGTTTPIGTLTGGTFLVAATGAAPGTATLSFGNTGEINVNAANVTINGNNALFADFNGLADNQGSFALLGQRAFTTPGSLQDEGTLTVDAGSTLQIQGDLTEANTSVLAVVIGGTATSGAKSPGVVQINGNANLAGTLGLSFTKGLATLPKATDVLAIGSVAAKVNGSFANVLPGQRLNTTDALGSFEVDYGPNAASPQLILLTNFDLPSPANPPVVNSALTAKGTQGVPFSYQITGTNSPTDFVATPLPAGLSLDTKKGIISGTPTTPGTTSVTLTAHNGAGNGTATLVITIAASAPVIGGPGGGAGGSGLTASGTVGTPFSYQISAQYSPTSYGATRLPTGLSLNTTTGLISGTPQVAGVTTTTVTATNSVGQGTATLTITIVNPAPSLGGGAPGGGGGKLSANGQVGVAFSYYVPVGGVVTSYALTNPPPGLSINTTTGQITGTPTTAGTFTSTVSATNSSGTGSATLTTTIIAANPPPPAITLPPGSTSLTASGQVAVAFGYQVPASGTVTSYNTTFNGLPPGLSINTATGVISGTPTKAGTYATTVYASNSGGTSQATLNITIAAPAPAITSAATATGQVGTAFTYTVTAANGPTSFAARGLPPGLSLNATTGVISGTPSTPGQFTVSLSAVNSALTGTGNVDTGAATLTITITQSAPIFGGGGAGGSSSVTVTAVQGQAFAYQIVFSGAPTSYGASGLPPGLSVDTGSGRISGTPTAVGTYTVNVSAFNAQGSGTGSVVINVAANPGPATTVVYNFSATRPSTNSEGAEPIGAVVQDSAGSLYGTASAGGTNGTGTVYEVNPAGIAGPLHTFSGLTNSTINGASVVTNSDGAIPYANLARDSAGNMYGTTTSGGTGGLGTIFRFGTGGSGFTVLHSFSPATSGTRQYNTDGYFSSAMVPDSAGNMYGATTFGGSTGGGTIYEIAAGSGAFSVLYNLPAAPLGNNYANSLVLGSDGNFYGTTSYGGTNHTGSFFRFVPGSGAFTILYNFPTGANIGTPTGPLVEGAAGTFYGSAPVSSSGYGAVYSFTVSSQTLTILHNFASGGSEGQAPQTGLYKGSDGNFYGTAPSGGSLGSGTIFRVTPAGGFTVVHSFNASQQSGPNTNVGGFSPGGLFQGANGILYGVTFEGGPNRNGTIYSLGIGAPVITSSPTTAATAGVAFNFYVYAVGNPIGYGVSGLPAGLTFNATTGLITGAVTTAGTYTISLSATNAVGTGTGTLTLTVNPGR